MLCESGPWSFKTAHAYITVIDAVSITCVPPPSFPSQQTRFAGPNRTAMLVSVTANADTRRRIALYGLLIFYGLTKEELAGRKPLAKFLSIKLIVMFTFYQALVVRTARRDKGGGASGADLPRSSTRWRGG